MAWFTTLSRRPAAGTSIVETPFVIGTILLSMIMPMICFASVGLRYSFVQNACRQAAHAAAQAKSFYKDFPPDYSACTTAQNTAAADCKAFTGINLNKVTTSLVITPVQGGTPVTQTAPLSAAADEENYLYQVQVTLAAEITPLISVPGGVFGMNIPGLTCPYSIQVSSQEVSENTQGLNK